MVTGKERLLRTLQLLQQQTDEDHQLSTAEIVAYFTAQGIPTDRKTVKADIDTMTACGIDIVAAKGTQTRYFYADQPFELPELKLLIDAVESSRFITAKKSKELVKKLISLTGKRRAEGLKRNLYTVGRVKPGNENVYYIVDAIHRAINQGQQISFLYYEYNANKERILRQSGRPYVFSPYAMLYNEDKYYVLGHSEEHKKIITFRVDRMEIPALLEAPVRPRPAGFDPVDYTVNVFSMYDGGIVTLKLLCANHLMNCVIDRFGDKIRTEIADARHFIADVEISVSRTFFAWVFQFAGDMQILEPEIVKAEYQQLIRRALQ